MDTERVMAQAAETNNPSDITYSDSSSAYSVDQIRFLLDNDLTEFYSYLTGKYWDNAKGAFVTMGQPSMNERGAQRVMQLLLFRGNPNFKLSNFMIDEIPATILTFSEILSQELGIRAEEFGINPEEFDTLINDCTDFARAVLKRSWNKGEKDFLTKTMEIKHLNTNSPKKFSIFNNEKQNGGM